MLNNMLDMKRYVFLLAIGVILCGCDGHVRFFKPIPAAGKTGTSAAADRQKVVDAVTAVASERGYTRKAAEPEVWFSKEVGRGRVEIRLIADNSSGEYHVELLDWPSTARSAESTSVEAAIQEKLSAH